MLNETLFLLSFDDLKDLLVNQLTIFHIAVVYVLMYVVYKSLGRYVYFKPEEHSSKINRTFLALSLFVVILHCLSGLLAYLPFLPEYRWLFTASTLVLLIAPFSIIVDRIIWRYRFGERERRNWHYDYLPISKDFYKTRVSKSSQNGNSISSWEEEGLESTRENIHSDALLNILALAVFIFTCIKWAYISASDHPALSYIFSIVIILAITGIFFDRAIFSWISYLEKIWANYVHKKKWPLF